MVNRRIRWAASEKEKIPLRGGSIVEFTWRPSMRSRPIRMTGQVERSRKGNILEIWSPVKHPQSKQGKHWYEVEKKNIIRRRKW